MRKFKFLTVILTFMVFLGAFAACNPVNSSSESSTPTHTCESVCEECGKCTDEACTDEACADKCQGHTVVPEHTCESKCPTCNKCTDADCTEEACEDKCQGHTVEPEHTCESVCPTCGKCTDADCTEEACADKCQGHTVVPEHTCESVCPTCNKCLDADCTEEACVEKCQGHTVEPEHTCESVCPTCNKCTDTDCTEEACEEKCAGHTQEPEPEPTHTCESVCPTCNKCLDADCTEEACEDKCAGHTVSGEHTCQTKCKTCGLCKSESCAEEACKNKCPQTGYIDVICKTCGMCSDATCDGTACGGKCPGHDEYGKYIDYRKDVFKNKKALFIGDSICAATSRNETETEYRGWAGRIGYSTGMECVNGGVSGASLSTKGPNADASGNSTKRILTQYMAVKDEHFDFIIMEGGVNDAWVSAEVGSVSASFNVEDFNVDTYAGALEELFYHVTKNHSNAKLGYMFTFQAPNFGTGRVSDMSEYYNTAKAVCEKWNVPFLNMYEDEQLNAEMKVDTNENLPDWIHPNTAGYNVLYTYIMYWMETLPVYSEIEEGYELESMPAEVVPAKPDVSCGGIWTKFY